MGKHIKVIASMVDMLYRTGKQESERGAYRMTRQMDEDTGEMSLFHYGTPTARVANGKPYYIYGESVSDADSLSTFLEDVTHPYCNAQFGYRPVNGGFYAVTWTNEKPVYVFYNDCEDGFDFARKVTEMEGY